MGIEIKIAAGFALMFVIIVCFLVAAHDSKYKDHPPRREQLPAMDGYDWFKSQLHQVMDREKLDPYEACFAIRAKMPRDEPTSFDQGAWRAHDDVIEDYINTLRADLRVQQLIRSACDHKRNAPGRMRVVKL